MQNWQQGYEHPSVAIANHTHLLITKNSPTG